MSEKPDGTAPQIVSSGGGWGEQFAGVVDGAACISPYPAAVGRRAFHPLLPGIEGEHPLHIPGDDHQAPFAADLVEATQQKLPEPKRRFDDAEHRFRDLFAQRVEPLAFGRRQADCARCATRRRDARDGRLLTI